MRAVVLGVDVFDQGRLQRFDQGLAEGDDGDGGNGASVAADAGEEGEPCGDDPDAPAQGANFTHRGGDRNGAEQDAELNDGADQAQGTGLGEVESKLRGDRQEAHGQHDRGVGVEEEAGAGGDVDPPSYAGIQMQCLQPCVQLRDGATTPLRASPATLR